MKPGEAAGCLLRTASERGLRVSPAESREAERVPTAEIHFHVNLLPNDNLFQSKIADSSRLNFLKCIC